MTSWTRSSRRWWPAGRNWAVRHIGSGVAAQGEMRRTDYVWNDPEGRVSIHLPLDVVSRLGLDAMEAYKSVPHGGLEIGGLLLGRRVGGTIYIDGFEPVESEHRLGPHYKLSERDTQVFEDALKRYSSAIGIYRTQTRLDSLALQVDDAELFSRYFNGPDNVYLLIQPSTGRAAFFLPQDGSLALIHEFPFRASDLPAEAEEQDEVPATPAPAPAAAMPVAIPVAVPHDAAREPVRDPGPVPPTARKTPWFVPVAAVLCGMACGALLYEAAHDAARRPAPAPMASAPAVIPASAPPRQAEVPGHIVLNVQRDGPSIRLLWDRNSPVIRNAAKGIVYIHDGEHESQLTLDPKELNTGLISYWPETRDVTFRMEIYATGHSSDDSIRVVGGTPVPVAQTRPAPVASSRPTPMPPAAVPAPPQRVPATQGSASRTETRPAVIAAPAPAPAAPPAPVVAESRPSPFNAPPKPTAVAPAPVAAAPPLPKPTEAQVSVRVEPVGGRGVLSRIPFLRRFRKQPQAFVPPTPLHEVKPSLTARERHELVGTVPVDLKVFVGDSGKVQYVELLSNSSRHESLVSLAVYAARRWEFTPARMGEEKVPSEVILHFRFTPEEPPEATR